MFTFWQGIFKILGPDTLVLAFQSEIFKRIRFPPGFDENSSLPSVRLERGIPNLVQDRGFHLLELYQEVGEGLVSNPPIGMVWKVDNKLMASVGSQGRAELCREGHEPLASKTLAFATN